MFTAGKNVSKRLCSYFQRTYMDFSRKHAINTGFHLLRTRNSMKCKVLQNVSHIFSIRVIINSNSTVCDVVGNGLYYAVIDQL